MRYCCDREYKTKGFEDCACAFFVPMASTYELDVIDKSDNFFNRGMFEIPPEPIITKLALTTVEMARCFLAYQQKGSLHHQLGLAACACENLGGRESSW